jgi:hypothetical protein
VRARRPARSGAGVRLDEVEARGLELLREEISRPAVGGDDRVVEGREDVADEEANEEVAAWSEDPSELVEGAADRARLVVDEGVPSQDAAVRVGRIFEIDDAADRERHLGVGTARVVDEGGYLVDASDVDALPGEMRCPVTGATAGVEERAFDRGSPSGDEMHVRRVHRRHRPEVLGVLRSTAPVGGEGIRWHGQNPRSATTSMMQPRRATSDTPGRTSHLSM